MAGRGEAPEHFGRRVAKLRAEAGLTQQEVAERLGLSRVAVSHLEAGLTDPSERTVVLLAGLFAVEPPALVAGTGYPRARADRLPLVAARYTELDHQLALLAADVAWLERLAALGLAAPERREVVAAWRAKLAALLAEACLPREREALRAALAGLTALAAPTPPTPPTP
ncbi:MAG: helix-turn-helix domain-containing protein [Acidimicrobiales bacterium]